VKKVLIWLGAILLIAGGMLIFLSGSLNPETLKPSIPALASISQTVWMGMAIFGLLLLIVSLFLRKK
jgi:hypothetical protein